MGSPDAPWPSGAGLGEDAADNSYEAVMRAADALFSVSPAAKTAPMPEAMQSTQPDDRGFRHDEDVFARGEPSGQDEIRGRILPVLDEPTSDPFAELEADRAPKRRGRKPGSKNKPKVPAFNDHRPSNGSVTAWTGIPGDQAPVSATDDDGADDPIWSRSSGPAAYPATATALLADGAPLREPARSLVGQPNFYDLKPRGGPRFAWVRTKLRPGEKWKRRLPKVVW